MKLLTLSVLSLLSIRCCAQLDDGNYFFNNSDNVSCTLKVSSGGFSISVQLTDGATTYNGTGSFRNEHGAGWYEFQSPECNFEFDVPSDTLRISKFDCKTGGKDMKYILAKSKVNSSTWIGTYKNSSGGVLTITKGIDESTFNFRMVTNDASPCPDLDWSGSAKISAPHNASDSKDCPITFELDGEKLTFSLDITCDGMVGMKCLPVFDGIFTRAGTPK